MESHFLSETFDLSKKIEIHNLVEMKIDVVILPVVNHIGSVITHSIWAIYSPLVKLEVRKPHERYVNLWGLVGVALKYPSGFGGIHHALSAVLRWCETWTYRDLLVWVVMAENEPFTSLAFYALSAQ